MLDHLLEHDIEPIADHRFTHTDAMAGSIEKIEVLAYRAANNLPLWHEHDNPETMPRHGKKDLDFLRWAPALEEMKNGKTRRR